MGIIIALMIVGVFFFLACMFVGVLIGAADVSKQVALAQQQAEQERQRNMGV